MTSPPQSSTLDSLPKQFVSAMRTLFDIMDDKRTGFVNFADIENRWQDDGSKGLPKGVIESLRKVTPPNGMLSFERFCAGLKICLLRNQVEQRQNQNQNHLQKRSTSERPPSAPALDHLDVPSKMPWTAGAANTAAVRPNNANISQQRTLSMPQLLSERKDNGGIQIQTANNENNVDLHFEKPVPNVNKPNAPPSGLALYGPPKPPRTALGIGQPQDGRMLPCPPPPMAGGGNLDRAEIRTALQNWQMGLLMHDHQQQQEKQFLRQGGRSLGDGKAAPQADLQTAGGYGQKKGNAKRREPRRHTLQNGIDYNMLKRMKQIEQEKDVLMQGLNAVEKAREWYLKQVAAVQEKMKYLGRMGHVEHWSEAQQERLELQRARVLEVNRHLAALTDSWERGGLPLHMNLAVSYHIPHPQPQDLATRLKRQNHLLTEEVSKKSERIAVLEREKASLIRELIQTRSGPTNRNGQEEAVF